MGKCQPVDVSKLESLKITNFTANFSMPFQFPFSVISRAISLINLINFPLQTLWEHNAQPSGKIAALYRRKFIQFPPFFHNFLCRADEFLNNKKKSLSNSWLNRTLTFSMWPISLDSSWPKSQVQLAARHRRVLAIFHKFSLNLHK